MPTAGSWDTDETVGIAVEIHSLGQLSPSERTKEKEHASGLRFRVVDRVYIRMCMCRIDILYLLFFIFYFLFVCL